MNEKSESELIAAVNNNPWDKEAYSSLLQHLLENEEENSDNVDLLEHHRQLFAERFMPDSRFWCLWLRDKIASSSVDQVINTLFFNNCQYRIELYFYSLHQ